MRHRFPQIKDTEELNPITEKIIGCAYKVSNTLGSGFLEKVYENALAYELRKTGLQVFQQQPIQVGMRKWLSVNILLICSSKRRYLLN